MKEIIRYSEESPPGASHRWAFRGEIDAPGPEAVEDSLSSLRLARDPPRRRAVLAPSTFQDAAPLPPRILSAVQTRLGPGAHHGGQDGGVP